MTEEPHIYAPYLFYSFIVICQDKRVGFCYFFY